MGTESRSQSRTTEKDQVPGCIGHPRSPTWGQALAVLGEMASNRSFEVPRTLDLHPRGQGVAMGTTTSGNAALRTVGRDQLQLGPSSPWTVWPAVTASETVAES